MDDLIRAKFPTLQRSRKTVATSGIPGSSSQATLPPRPDIPPRVLSAQIHPLYEDGSEKSKGFYSVHDSGFIVHSPPSDGSSIYPVEFRPAQRPGPPTLMDKDTRKMRLPRKTAPNQKAKRKRRIKGKKIIERKRPRHFPPVQDRQPNRPSMSSVGRSAVWKPARSSAGSIRLNRRPMSPEGDNIDHEPPDSGSQRLFSKPTTGLLIQRGRKTVIDRPLSPPITPTLHPDQHNHPLALDSIARGIIRLDPALARYSTRSAPLFLARNLRDGWTGKVQLWDQEGSSTKVISPSIQQGKYEAAEERLNTFIAEATRRSSATMNDITQAPLPRTFCLKLKGLKLGDLAKVGLPSSTRIGAILYIDNHSDNRLAFDLGTLKIDIPQSASFFSSPIRIPPSNCLDTNTKRPNTSTPHFVRTVGQDEASSVSLRELDLPNGIAYVDLLLYDFADSSMDLRGIHLTWSAANATRLYARVEIAGPNAGPNGFANRSQDVPLVWLRSAHPNEPNSIASSRTEIQPKAFLDVDLEWGVDSAARLLRPRVPIIAPQRIHSPSNNIRLVYRIGLQGGNYVLEREVPPWVCVLCDICAPFPTRHILKVHIRRAHAQVDTRFSKQKADALTGKITFNVKLILPPEAIELPDDDEESPVAEMVAPSTRIGDLLAAPEEANNYNPETLDTLENTPSTPPPIGSNPIKQEQEEREIGLWQAENMPLLPIIRARSHSPTPTLESPVRRRRDYQSSPPISPIRPEQPGATQDRPSGRYSSRTNNINRIYDVLRDLPTHHGVMTGQVVAAEEEMFAEDRVSESSTNGAGSDQARLMAALWFRWMTVEKNRFIENAFDTLNRFFSSFYLDVIVDYVGYKHLARFLVELASRGRIKSKEVATLCKRYKERAQELLRDRYVCSIRQPTSTCAATMHSLDEPTPKTLPPGVVLGPDGKPCRVCSSFKSWSKKQRSDSKKSSGPTPLATTGLATAASASTSSVAQQNCPPDVKQLGRATWTFLHTTAAYYPESPNKQQQSHMLSLLRSLSSLYPCSHCATDFGKDLRANPPDAAVLGRSSLSRWLCERHNEVNEKLGKTKFDCGIQSLDTRWKDGPSDGSCD